MLTTTPMNFSCIEYLQDDMRKTKQRAGSGSSWKESSGSKGVWGITLNNFRCILYSDDCICGFGRIAE
jgi:hypothetical protein